MFYYRYLVIASLMLSQSSALYAASPGGQIQHNKPPSTVSIPGKSAVQSQVFSNNKLDINTASVKDLRQLTGMNRSKARSIVSYRNKHGHLTSLDDLRNVSGFKRMKDTQLEIIKNQLKVERHIT